MPEDASSTAEAPPEDAPRTFGGLTPAEASRRRWEKQRERDAKGEGSAPHATTRTPLDALRDLMAADPEAYAAGLAKLVRDGDPRAITIMRDLFNVKGSVSIPRAESTIRALSPDDRRALLLELEAKGCTLPTLPDEPMPVDAASDEASGRVAVGDTREPDSMP